MTVMLGSASLQKQKTIPQFGLDATVTDGFTYIVLTWTHLVMTFYVIFANGDVLLLTSMKGRVRYYST